MFYSHKTRRYAGGIVTAIAFGMLASCNSAPQSAMPPDDPDMALKLAYIDGVEPTEASKYVNLMEDLDQICSENRALIGGISKGIADLGMEYDDMESSNFEGMRSLYDIAKPRYTGAPISCMEVFTEIRRAYGDI